MRLHYEITNRQFLQLVSFLAALLLSMQTFFDTTLELSTEFYANTTVFRESTVAYQSSIVESFTALLDSQTTVLTLFQQQVDFQNSTDDRLHDVYSQIHDWHNAWYYDAHARNATFDTILVYLRNLTEELTLLNKKQEEIYQILSPAPVEPVLNVLNNHVSLVTYQTSHALDTALDFCEYDPLGVGPIECEGSNFIEGRFEDLKFEPKIDNK